MAVKAATGIPAGKQEKAKSRILKAVKAQNEITEMIRNASNLDSDAALHIAKVLQEKGLLSLQVVKSGPGREQFVSFLRRFWDYETSPYVREKRAHGQSIGKRHCYESMSRFTRYWQPAFRDRALNSITRQDLKDFSLSLAEGGLAPASINKIMAVGATALTWAFREELIPSDPTTGLINFSGGAKKRGVLTPLEAQALFAAKWKDARAYAASLLACTTGMRSGEVLALRQEDIGERVLNVRHSWSSYDGLKAPKSGESRKVPLLPEVRGKLLELAQDNPYGPEGFIFYGNLADKPVDRSVLLDGLHNALAEIGIDSVARGIVFHSWRHYYAARMADRMTADQVSRVTGHKSRVVFEKYAAHLDEQNLEEVGRVGAEVFGNILSFRKGA